MSVASLLTTAGGHRAIVKLSIDKDNVNVECDREDFLYDSKNNNNGQLTKRFSRHVYSEKSFPHYSLRDKDSSEKESSSNNQEDEEKIIKSEEDSDEEFYEQVINKAQQIIVEQINQQEEENLESNKLSILNRETKRMCLGYNLNVEIVKKT